jgi:uncharacterized OsmC-like protein
MQAKSHNAHSPRELLELSPGSCSALDGALRAVDTNVNTANPSI